LMQAYGLWLTLAC